MAECGENKFHTSGCGHIMPATGIWVNPENNRWGIIKPRSPRAQAIQDAYDAEIDEKHS